MELNYSDFDDRHIIFAAIFFLANRLQTIGDSFFAEISTKQWFILVVLKIMNGYSPTLSELSAVVGSSHQNVKQMVLKLEQKGYVQVSKDKNDSRRLRIKVTEKVEEFSKEYDQKSDEFLNQLFGHFKDEELTVTKNVMLSMKAILEGMENEYVKG